jgi:hypothetical protein
LHFNEAQTFVLFFSPAVIVIFLTINTLEVVSKLLAPNVQGLALAGHLSTSADGKIDC